MSEGGGIFIFALVCIVAPLAGILVAMLAIILTEGSDSFLEHLRWVCKSD